MANNFATVLAADGGKVTVKLSRPADFDSSFVEFIGTVDAPNQITEVDRTSFGNTFGAPQPIGRGLLHSFCCVVEAVSPCVPLDMCYVSTKSAQPIMTTCGLGCRDVNVQ